MHVWSWPLLSRYVVNDFRTGKYFGACLLSVTALSMILLARRLRGRTSITDVVLPLAILSIGQAESLTLTFAMALITTTCIAFALLAALAQADGRHTIRAALVSGSLLVLLPLSSGGGLVMLPGLMLWFAGFAFWNWWSGRDVGGMARAIGVGSLSICTVIAVLYMRGYTAPSHHPATPSIKAAALTTLEFLSTVITPNAGRYWIVGGVVVSFLIASTLYLLATSAHRSPRERTRAAGLSALILAMISMAAVVGISRSGFGPTTGLQSRYITLTAPLFGAIYFSWSLYGSGVGRRLVHGGLLASMLIMLPANVTHGLRHGETVRQAQRRVERFLMVRLPADEIVKRSCPAVHTDAKRVRESFSKLKQAGFGAFKLLNDGGDAASVIASGSSAVRR